MKVKYPIKVIKDEFNNRVKIAADIDMLLYDSKNLKQELVFLEDIYVLMVESIKEILTLISKKKNIDPRLYWFVGDQICRFTDQIGELGYYLMNQNDTIARDIGLSDTSVEKIISFRKRFPKISTIDPYLPWSSYRENKVIISKKSNLKK